MRTLGLTIELYLLGVLYASFSAPVTVSSVSSSSEPLIFRSDINLELKVIEEYAVITLVVVTGAKFVIDSERKFLSAQTRKQLRNCDTPLARHGAKVYVATEVKPKRMWRQRRYTRMIRKSKQES